jgi:phage shock protein A
MDLTKQLMDMVYSQTLREMSKKFPNVQPEMLHVLVRDMMTKASSNVSTIVSNHSKNSSQEIDLKKIALFSKQEELTRHREMMAGLKKTEDKLAKEVDELSGDIVSLQHLYDRETQIIRYLK